MPASIVHQLALAVTFSMALLGDVSARSLNNNAETSLANIFARKNGGINCDGSGFCVDFSNNGNGMKEILNMVNLIPINKAYVKGQQLACTGGGNGLRGALCASVCENTDSYTIAASENGNANSAGDVINDLVYHGCKACGTAPTVRVGNDLSKGCLSVNYVDQDCGNLQGKPCPGWNH